MNKGFYLKHPILGYFLTFSFLFFPAFTNDYIWSDEYSYQFDLYSLRSDSVANLRPVLGAMTYMNGIFSIDVNGYAFVRLIAVLGLAFAAYEVQLAFANIISSKILFPSIVLALSTFPFQNWIYLGVCAPYCWAAYLSLLAIRIIRSKGSISSIVFGAILVILAIGIYPLAALIPLPIYYIKNFLSRVPRFSALKSNFRLLSFFALTGIVSLVLFRFVANLLGRNATSRTILLDGEELWSTLVFNLTRNIVQSYRIFWLDSPSEIKAFVEVSVVIFILIIAIKYWRREYGIFDIFFELIMITIVMFLTLAPIWIVGYNQVEIRFLAISGLFPALLIGLIFSTFVGGTIDSNLSRTRTKTLYAIFLMLAMLFSYKHYDQGLSPILINTKEFVQSELSGCSRRQIVEGVTIQTRVGAFPNRNFLGMYSQSTDLASEWVQIPAIRAFIDRDMKSIDLNEISFQMNRKSDLNRMCIIDLNRYVAPSSR